MAPWVTLLTIAVEVTLFLARLLIRKKFSPYWTVRTFNWWKFWRKSMSLIGRVKCQPFFSKIESRNLYYKTFSHQLGPYFDVWLEVLDDLNHHNDLETTVGCIETWMIAFCALSQHSKMFTFRPLKLARRWWQTRVHVDPIFQKERRWGILVSIAGKHLRTF